MNTPLNKVVTERMRRHPAGAHHPDANLLNAFAERSLTSAEREEVLAHLATCAPCRQIVTLSQPQAAELQPVFASTAAPRRWSVWHWAAPMAAAVTIVGVFLATGPDVFQRSSPVTSEQVAQQSRDVAPVAASEAKIADGAAGNMASAYVQTKAAPAKKPSIARRARQALKDRLSLPAAPALVARAADEQLTGAISNRVFLPKREQRSFARDAYAPTVFAAGGTGGGAFQISSAPSAAVTAAAEPVGDENIRIEAEAPEADAAVAKVQNGFAALSTRAEAAEEFARAGKAKQSITASENVSLELRMARAPGEIHQWRIRDGRLQYLEPRARDDRWEDRIIGSGEKLRVLAFRGTEIWVGSEVGTLYRSSDDGKSWERVGIGLPSDVAVTAISFNTNVDGELRTFTGERWTTADGGRTWKKTD